MEHKDVKDRIVRRLLDTNLYPKKNNLVLSDVDKLLVLASYWCLQPHSTNNLEVDKNVGSYS